MKDLDPTNLPNKEELREERQELKEISLLGDMTLPKGHIVYDFDIKTLVLKRAEYEKVSTVDTTRGELGTLVKGKIKHNPEHIYFTALNDKNAIRKISNNVLELGISPSLVKFESHTIVKFESHE